MVRILSRTFAREGCGSPGTALSFFALNSRWALDLGGGPRDPFDWIAVLCLYAVF